VQSRRFGVFFWALLGAAVATVFAVIYVLALMGGSDVATPVLVVVGALGAALGAFWGGERSANDGSHGRLPAIFLAALVVSAAWTALSILWAWVAHTFFHGNPPALLLPLGLLLTAGAATVAARRLRDPAGSRRMASGLRDSAALLAVVGLCLVGAVPLDREMTCGYEQRAVLGEFPQYGGIAQRPRANSVHGSCYLYYLTPDSREQVEAYFSQRLRTNGWEVEVVGPFPKGSAGGDLVRAIRGEFLYVVHYISSSTLVDPRPGGQIEVHVSYTR